MFEFAFDKMRVSGGSGGGNISEPDPLNGATRVATIRGTIVGTAPGDGYQGAHNPPKCVGSWANAKRSLAGAKQRRSTESFGGLKFTD